ncbi:MAG: acetate--CoA ligase family protein [Planctomycetaceae bacterium]
MNLRPLLAPRSIAIVGASESPDSWAPEVYTSLRHLGYEGAIYPVHPKYERVWGLPCVPSVLDLPKGVDLAVFVIRADRVVSSIDDCARAGVRSLMVVASGFAEAGPDGRALQEELRAKALAHKLPLLGPNIEGFVNYTDKVAPYGTLPPPHPVAGDISVISQSGTVAWAMNQQASDRAVGLRVILGVGNEAVIGLGDMYEWAAEDPDTAVVCTYIETLRDVAGIERGLRALQAARKPVLVCAPGGRSEAAQRSIVAHTGALAGNTGVRDAWLRGLGTVLVEDPVIMFEAAVLLSSYRRTRTTGVSAALQSGGACTLFAEAAGAEGLELPSFAKDTERKLKKALPSFANLNNPLDVTGQAAVETDMYCEALEALAADPSLGFIAIDAFPPRGDDEHDAIWAWPVIQKAKELQRRTGVAFASISMTPLAYGDGAKGFTRRSGLPFIQGHRAVAGAIRALMDLQATRRRAVKPRAPHPNRTAAVRVLRGRSGPLDEERAARILELYGVRRPKEKLVNTPEQAAVFARTVRGTVAVKAAAPEIPHKAKLGGVRLGLEADDVEGAAHEVLAAARKAGARAPRVLVQEMAAGAEVLIGAIVDHQFGPAITIRPGGALAEAGEAEFVAAPLTRAQARAFVEAQAERCRLDPARHDLGAVARAVEAIAHAASDLRERLTSLEANPLLVAERGAVAVDALAEARP